MADAYEVAGKGGEPVTRVVARASAEPASPPPSRVIGGVSRLQLAQVSAEALGAANGVSSRVHGTAYRFSAVDGEVHAVNRETGNAAEGPGGDVLATACRASGTPIEPSKMDARSVVTWMGAQVPVGVAIQMGAPIEADPSGGYRYRAGNTPPGESPVPPSAEEQVPQEETGGLADDYGLAAEEVGAFEAIAKSVDSRIIEAIAETIITDGRADALEHAVTGEAMASAGVSQHARAVLDGLQREGDRAVSALGADPSTFYAWAWQNEAKGLREAMRQHFKSGDARAYAMLVKTFRDLIQ